MLSSCQTEHGEQEESEKCEESPHPASERALRLPEFLRQEHHNDQEARMAAEDEVATVERVAQHRSLVDEDVFDGGGSVARHPGTTVGRGAGEKRPPAHESLAVMERESECLAENHDARNPSEVCPHFVADGRVQKETSQHAEEDVGHEDHVGRLSVGEGDFGNEREPNIESADEWIARSVQ